MSGDVTQWLHRWRRGDPQAQAHLFDLIYPALREMAAARIGQRHADVTLRPTALMHEALLRVMGSDVEFVDRAHFLALAALKMRVVLVDFARSGAAAKRGAGAWNLTLSHADQDVPYAPTCGYEVLALHQALNQLAGHDERRTCGGIHVFRRDGPPGNRGRAGGVGADGRPRSALCEGLAQSAPGLIGGVIVTGGWGNDR